MCLSVLCEGRVVCAAACTCLSAWSVVQQHMHKCHKTQLSQAVWRLCADQTVLRELFQRATHLQAESNMLLVRIPVLLAWRDILVL
jgi:hypothetical protein